MAVPTGFFIHPNPRRNGPIRQKAFDDADVGALIDRLAACLSGAMYAAVPRIMPACVIAGVVMVGDNETSEAAA